MGLEKRLFNRTELLYGPEKMEQIASVKVIIFGIGGVGSWCAESLIRSGIKYITVVDSDRICITNVNRQLHATTLTIGEVKTDALKKRLLEINPNAKITALQKNYNAENRDSFKLEEYDYIIDAIDSLDNKADLIDAATHTNAVFFSSMGAALKVDPTKIQVAEFWKVKGDPLAACMRRIIRKREMPGKKFLCVYSEEVLPKKGVNTSFKSPECLIPKSTETKGYSVLDHHEWSEHKASMNGTVAHITAIFGFTLAGLVMQDLYCKKF